MNDKSVALGLTIILLLIAGLLTRNGDVVWMIVPFLAYLGVGILQAPRREVLSFGTRRTWEQNRVDGKVSTAVVLTVQNKGLETVHLFLQESAQPEMEITEGELSQRVSLQPGESTELKYSFTAIRGDFSWKSIRTVVSDPLNLIETEMLLPDDSSIQVRPPIKKFKSIALRPNNTVHSPGSIPARLGGSGTDFFGVRQYHPGDSLHTLDWRLTARHPGRFFTKEFEQEEIAEIGLILDARPNNELRIRDESSVRAQPRCNCLPGRNVFTPGTSSEFAGVRGNDYQRLSRLRQDTAASHPELPGEGQDRAGARRPGLF